MSEKKSSKDSARQDKQPVVTCPHCGASFTPQTDELQKGAKTKASAYGVWVAVIIVLVFIGWLITPKPDNTNKHNHDVEVTDNGSSTGSAEKLPEGHPPIDSGMQGMMGETTADGTSVETPSGHPSVEGGEPMPDEVMQKFRELKQKVEENPKDTDSLKELGNMYFDIGWPDKAIEYYTLYLAINPDDAFVLNDIGRMYIAIEDTDNAVKNLNRSIELNQSLPQPFINLGLAYMEQGKYAEALAAVDKAIAVSTDPKITEGAKFLKEQIETAQSEEMKKADNKKHTE